MSLTWLKFIDIAISLTTLNKVWINRGLIVD